MVIVTSSVAVFPAASVAMICTVNVHVAEVSTTQVVGSMILPEKVGVQVGSILSSHVGLRVRSRFLVMVREEP